MTQPYEGEETYGATPVYPDSQVTAFLEKALERVQIAVHCNGDAAAEQLPPAMKKPTRPAPGHPAPYDPRPAAAAGPSAPAAPLWEWLPLSLWPMCTTGGTCTFKTSAGERAQNISPAKLPREAGVVFDFHQDTPVILPNMLETLWCAVCRRTKAGTLLGEGQRCPRGARAITVNAAWALFEEGKRYTSRASGRTGHSDRDPFCPPEELKDLRVMETIKDGETVFRASE